MAEETYEGIPRSKIPWGPTIDYNKCIRCGTCVDYCKLGAYEFNEDNGEKKPIVKNPDACVVFCTGCEEQCPVGAIKHPSKEETQKIIEKLLKRQE
jgi:NAD-dependent dihydropyrimidine dehydrogenase PreA subunit